MTSRTNGIRIARSRRMCAAGRSPALPPPNRGSRRHRPARRRARWAPAAPTAGTRRESCLRRRRPARRRPGCPRRYRRRWPPWSTARRPAMTGYTKSSSTAIGWSAGSTTATCTSTRATARSGRRRCRRSLPRCSAWTSIRHGSTARSPSPTRRGSTSFQQLQNALSNPRAKNISYFVFDLLYQDGYDLRGVALTERKRLLRALIGKSDAALRYSVDVQGSGAEFFEQACKLKLEGAVSKRANSLYREGVRTRDWLKVKCGHRQEMVIGGFTDPQGSRSRIRRAAARHLRGGQAPLRRQGRHRIRRQDADQAAACPRQARAEGGAVRQPAARLRGQGRALGQAAAGGRDRVHRVEQ